MLHLGKNHPSYNYTTEDYNVIKDLETTVSEKDLGVNVDPLLTFENHISLVVKKSRSLSGLIIRSITTARHYVECANVVLTPF